jgi:hypothetical protein
MWTASVPGTPTGFSAVDHTTKPGTQPPPLPVWALYLISPQVIVGWLKGPLDDLSVSEFLKPDSAPLLRQ